MAKGGRIYGKETICNKGTVRWDREKYPTPFHLYDEKGIRENAEAVKEAFAWNPGFREYFAVKATPNPFILNILKEYDCGCDCSSLTELMLADSQGFDGQHIMFSSNDTPAEEFALRMNLVPSLIWMILHTLTFRADDRTYSGDHQLPLQSGRCI